MPLPQPPPDRSWTLRARWVFPADAPPLPGGCVTIRGGRIVRVGPADGTPVDLDLDAAVLPGFVNAHVHLDLTGLRGQCPPTPDLPAWLRSVRARRLAQTPVEVEAAIRVGIAECVRFGTTLLGDISSLGTSWSSLCAAPLRSVVFYELLGLTPERAREAEQCAHAWLADRHATDRCRPGLSPHAPYSVRRELFAQAAASAHTGLPVAIHLAESVAELQLLRGHDGPFADFLRDLNVWAPDGLVSSPDEILALFRDAPAVLFAHGNYLAPDAPVGPGHTVVYCPRTHAAFGHAPHPFRALLARGVRVALGTDSLASNPDLDVLAEARFLHALDPNFDGAALLRMLTLSGAAALGWASETGSLTPGKSADLVVLPLPAGNPGDAHRLLWESDHGVQAVMFRGEWQLAGSVPPA